MSDDTVDGHEDDEAQRAAGGGSDDDAVNDTEERYGADESPA